MTDGLSLCRLPTTPRPHRSKQQYRQQYTYTKRGGRAYVSLARGIDPVNPVKSQIIFDCIIIVLSAAEYIVGLVSSENFDGRIASVFRTRSRLPSRGHHVMLSHRVCTSQHHSSNMHPCITRVIWVVLFACENEEVPSTSTTANSRSRQGDPVSMLLLTGIFRLIRLARLARLLKTLRELWLLVAGLVASVKTLFWATLMLVLCVYVASIIVHESVAIDTSYPDDVRNKWNSLFKAMFRLMQIITFDSDGGVPDVGVPQLSAAVSAALAATGGAAATAAATAAAATAAATAAAAAAATERHEWLGMVLEISHDKPAMFLFLIAFVVVTALGLMNLIVGVMVEQSYQLVAAEKVRVKADRMAEAKEALMTARSLFTQVGTTSVIHLQHCSTINCRTIFEKFPDPPPKR